MPVETPPQRIPLSPVQIGLCAILLVAVFLRATRLDLMAFEMDEGVACIFAIRYTHHGLLPLVGVKTSLGFYNSPLFIYLLSPAFLVTTDARFAVFVFALLGTAAVYIVYRTGREFFSPSVGLLAAAMMAVSPAAVDYSRRLWGHSLIQVLSPFAFYFLLRWIVARRTRAIFWLAAIVAVAQQFHFSGALLWLQLLLALVLFRPRTDWAAFLCGSALGLLGYLPFMIHQFDTEFADVRQMAHLVIRGAGETDASGFWPLHYWALAATDLGRNNFLQSDFREFLSHIYLYRTSRAIAGAAWIAALIAAGASAAIELRGRNGWRALGEGRAARPILLLTWSLVPLAVFLLLRVPVVAPYFLIIFPVPFLAIAWAVVQLWKQFESPSLQPRFRRAGHFLIALLIGLWGAHQLVYHALLRARLDGAGGGSGTYVSYGAQRQAMYFIANHAPPGQPVVLSEGHRDPADGINFRYWFLLWTADHDMKRYFPADRERARYWYVIRNTNYRVRADFDLFLNAFDSRQFGLLTIVIIPRPGPWPRFGPN